MAQMEIATLRSRWQEGEMASRNSVTVPPVTSMEVEGKAQFSIRSLT